MTVVILERSSGIQPILPCEDVTKAGFPRLFWIIRVRKALYFVTICYRKLALNRAICSNEYRNYVAHSTENPLRLENDAGLASTFTPLNNTKHRHVVPDTASHKREVNVLYPIFIPEKSRII